MDDLKQNFGMNNFKILMTTISLLALLLTIAGLLMILRESLSKNWLPPAPRLSDSSRQQLKFESGALARQSKETQTQDLNSYAWLEREHHFAKVPVARAMEI